MSRWLQAAGAIVLVGGLAACAPQGITGGSGNGTATVVVTASKTPTPASHTGGSGDSTYQSLERAFDGSTAVDPSHYRGLVTPVGFATPDNSITCGIDHDSVTCQLLGSASFKSPKDCHGAGDGHAVRFADHRQPAFACMGDVESGGPVLANGHRITVGNLRCLSKDDQVSCVDDDGHGFRLGTGGYLMTGKGQSAPSPTSTPPTTQQPRPTQQPQPTSSTSLDGRYFVGMGTFNISGSDGNYYGVWFLGDGWAYWGRPKSGAPSCNSVTGAIGGEPGTGWGCVRYSYDPSGGRLTIGGKSGSYRSGVLNVGDWTFEPTLLPATGTRLSVNLINRGYEGMCGPYGGCSTWSTSLAMTQDGHFVLTSSSINSYSGSGSFGWAASYPPDQKGTYQVNAGGTVTLHFDSGKSVVATFAERYDANGKLDPSDLSGQGGVVLGVNRFWRDSE